MAAIGLGGGRPAGFSVGRGARPGSTLGYPALVIVGVELMRGCLSR